MSDDTNQRMTIAELTARMAASRERMELLIARTGGGDLIRPGDEGWSVKDHLAHIAAWEQSLTDMLNGQPHADALGVDPETYEAGIDRTNAVIQERVKDHSLAEVLRDYRAAREATLITLSGWSDADLYRPVSSVDASQPADRDGPILDWIVDNTSGHDNEHLPWIEAILGGPSDSR